MRLSNIFLPLAALTLAPSVALAADAGDAAPQPVQAENTRHYIAFANKGGLWDWHADGSEVIYFQDRRKQWYRAELMSRAHDLPFAQHIGLDTGPGDRLDKWSTIYVRGQRYVLSSFEPVPGEKPWQGAEAGGNS
jgi:hypothetical protein